MDVLLKVSILLILSGICIQDMMSRNVYLLLFVFLGVLFILLRILSIQQTKAYVLAVLINFTLLAVQFLLVSAWFSFKNGSWTNITIELIGWGDIVLLISLAFYFSPLSYFVFYIISLIFILSLWSGWQFAFSKGNHTIPLAGLQALLMGLFLCADWWIIHVNATNDNWLLKYIIK